MRRSAATGASKTSVGRNKMGPLARIRFRKGCVNRWVSGSEAAVRKPGHVTGAAGACLRRLRLANGVQVQTYSPTTTGAEKEARRIGRRGLIDRSEEERGSYEPAIDQARQLLAVQESQQGNVLRRRRNQRKMQKPLADLLQEYNLPIGIFPGDSTNYEFDEETKKLTVFIPSVCEVGYKDSSILRFLTTVTGYLENGKMSDIEGMKTKVLIWTKVASISTEGTKVHFYAGVKKTRSRDAYEVLRVGIAVDKF